MRFPVLSRLLASGLTRLPACALKKPMADSKSATGIPSSPPGRACRRRPRTGSLLCLAATAAAVLAGCREPVVVVERMLAGGADVTFFVAADTHFGFAGIDALNKRQIEAMNSLPHAAYPPAIGGEVARPRGLLIAGDLTEHGLLFQWRQFVAFYGLTGADGLLQTTSAPRATPPTASPWSTSPTAA